MFCNGIGMGLERALEFGVGSSMSRIKRDKIA